MVLPNQRQTIIRLQGVGLTSDSLQPPGQKRPRVQQILQPLDLAIKAGDRIALVGPPGSGKTSLLRLLNRLAPPSQGTIDWLGDLVGTTSDLRRRILMVPAVPQFFGQTVRQSLTYPLALRGLPPEKQTQAILNADLPKDWLDRPASFLSQGQQQRVALLRAFLCEPQVLLLDEPMSHGDVVQGDWVAKQLGNRSQITVVIASGQLDWVRGNVDRVVHLDGGKLQTDSIASAFDWQQLKTAFKEMPSDEWNGL